MDTKILMVKLSNDNYFTWKFKMEMLLKKEGVWKALTESRPADDDDNADKLAKWIENDEKAFALIGLSVQDNQLQTIRNAKSAKESWEALKNFHEQGTLVNTTTLMRNLWSMKLERNTDPQPHMQKMRDILQKLVDLGEQELAEKWKISLLLSSLPDDYNTLVTALEARDTKDLTLSLVQTKIIDEYMRRNNGNADSKSEFDQVMKIDPKRKNKKQIFCYYCKMPNHKMQQCRKLKEAQKNENKVNAVNDDGECSEQSANEEFLFMVQTDNDKVKNEWTLDSGATSHTVKDKELFAELDENYNTSVKVANGNYSTIRGIGSCKVKFTNEAGEATNVRMTKVLYAPDLEGNFISIWKLCQNGFTVIFHGTVGEIWHKEKQIAVVPISKNMYNVNLDKVCSLSKKQEYCIHQWHRILGHRDVNAINLMKKIHRW